LCKRSIRTRTSIEEQVGRRDIAREGERGENEQAHDFSHSFEISSKPLTTPHSTHPIPLPPCSPPPGPPPHLHSSTHYGHGRVEGLYTRLQGRGHSPLPPSMTTKASSNPTDVLQHAFENLNKKKRKEERRFFASAACLLLAHEAGPGAS